LTVRAAVAFLTPFGGARSPTSATLDWFPAVGVLIGLALGGLWWATSQIWTASVAAAIVVVGDLVATGMLHFDGLVDSADGLLPPMGRERRLEVMARPDIGAFGVGAGVSLLIARFAALSALRPGVLLLGGLWCLSRTVMAIVARTLPYARGEEGLARVFLAPAQPAGLAAARRWIPLGAGVGLAAGLLVWWQPAAGAAAGAAALVAAGAVVGLARRRLGGYTGDVLGACGVLAETAGLIVAAARW
jgi:adenosylcobinamide-GDP ribazoletransferase